MTKKLFPALILTFNLTLFLILSFIIIGFTWKRLGQEYVFGLTAVGGDYFNALTYQTYFHKFLPNPATGWLPFWHEGVPVIGGYPSLSFYLSDYLTKYFEVATSMNLFSIGALLLFFISCLILFWQVSKNWLIASTLTAALIATRASYYQLTTGGFIASASAQWYLPAVLFLIFRFAESFKIRYLILGAIFTGLSLLHQAPSSLLLVFIPVSLVLLILSKLHYPFSKTFSHLALFISITLTIGSLGLYTVYLQTFFGSGTDQCQSPQCWGIYPKHLVVWLNPMALILAVSFLLFTTLAKFFKPAVKLSYALPALVGLGFFILYGLAAYLKLINGLANVIFPTRIFWAGNLMLLLLSATLYRSMHQLVPLLSIPLSVVASLGIFFYIIQNQLSIHRDFPTTIPLDIASYTIPNYQSKPVTDLVPDWLMSANTNWRVDIFNPGVYHWWNTVSEIPVTRGYSNHPVGVHRDWLYFLQITTRGIPQDIDQEFVKNRSLFLLDAYGVGFFENSMLSYPKSILDDTQIVVNRSIARDLSWHQLSPNFVTPIIYPTNTQPVLFIGDDKGFENFIRSLSMTNLNSKFLVPVRGPTNLDNLSKEHLATFPVLVLYRFSGSNFKQIPEYIKAGGKVFIETGSSTLSKGKLPDPFPIKSLEESSSFKEGRLEDHKSKLLHQIQLKAFSPLEYQKGPWKLSTSKDQDIKSWGELVLSYNKLPVLVEGRLEKGVVVWSGLNLPFHIVDNNNLEEAKFFKNIILNLLEKQPAEVGFRVERKKPNLIEVVGKGFSGIYFKENYHSGWKAKSEGKNLKIYKAGLDFMYIPVPKKNEEQKVILTFKGNVSTWGLMFLTIMSILFSLIYLIIPYQINRVVSFIATFLQQKVETKFINFVKEQWSKEE